MTTNKSAIISVLGFLSILTFGLANAEQTPKEWSRTRPYPVHDVYYPGTEALAPDEMRVIACGTGMPTPRLKQPLDVLSSNSAMVRSSYLTWVKVRTSA